MPDEFTAEEKAYVESRGEQGPQVAEETQEPIAAPDVVPPAADKPPEQQQPPAEDRVPVAAIQEERRRRKEARCWRSFCTATPSRPRTPR